jgi:hypothetical protein
MTGAHPQTLGLVSKLVVASAIVLIAAGVYWRGVTEDDVERIWANLIARPSGPMSFRFILQPSMAAIAAIHHGLRDARTGRSPFLWTILREPQKRIERLDEGLNATARIILLGLAMDVIYQRIEFETFYPVEALIIALLLAFVPYVLIRGPVARIARRWRGHVSAGGSR